LGGGPQEKDTCRDYVLPRLKAAGWSDDQIVEQLPITDGRIVTVGRQHRRAGELRADYVLEYKPGVPIAVVEAQRKYAMAAKGLQQAKRYAGLLDVPLAYSTNGTTVVEDDRNTGIETDSLTGSPSPDALWSRYRAKKVKRTGHGFRNFDNYRLRLLLHCGVDWHDASAARLRTRRPRSAA